MSTLIVLGFASMLTICIKPSSTTIHTRPARLGSQSTDRWIGWEEIGLSCIFKHPAPPYSRTSTITHEQACFSSAVSSDWLLSMS